MRWTLSTKFSLVVAALVASAILGSIVSLVSARHSTELLEQAIEESLPSVRAAEEIEIALLEQQRIARRYVLDGEKRPWREPLEARKADFAHWLDLARRTTRSQDGVEILGRLESAYVQYGQHRDRAIELCTEGRSDEAKPYFLSQVAAAHDETYAICEEFITNNERYVRAMEDRVRAGIRWVTSLAFVSVGMTVALGATLLAIFFIKIILPLRRVRADAEKLSPNLGDVGQRSGNDELASVAHYLRSLMLDVENTRTQLAQSHHRLEVAEKLASVGKLAASVAHEIRNPLTAIKMWLFAIHKSVAGDAELERRVRLISGEIARLEGIIRSFLEFSRPAPPQLAPRDVRRLVEKTTELFRPQIEAKQLRLVVSVPEGLPSVLADEEQVGQVLMNLLANAAEATSSGGEVRVSAEAARDAAGRAAVAIRVQDTGAGMPDEVRRRLFEPFFTTKEGGTGLGLCIAAGIVARHHGSLVLESANSAGTCFAVWLPTVEDGA
ncbi:MAG: ATP-binding protein [Thermoguttaceae bacterium]|jgi:signal transduction histidine kinase|nr:ATP-binding protein [Thermoguttaceae bacterium]